jgi:hypothetical protein
MEVWTEGQGLTRPWAHRDKKEVSEQHWTWPFGQILSCARVMATTVQERGMALKTRNTGREFYLLMALLLLLLPIVRHAC